MSAVSLALSRNADTDGRSDLGLRIPQADGAHAVHGAVVRGDDRRALAAAIPPAADELRGPSGSVSRRERVSSLPVPTRSPKGCTSRSSDAGRAIFPASHSPTGEGPRLPGLHGAHGRPGPGLGVRSQVMRTVMSESLVLLGIVIAALSGLPGFLWGRTSMSGQWVTTLLAVLGAGLGLGGVGSFWATGDSQPIVLPWSLPGAEFSVAMDGLSAIFLVPIFLISLLGNVYGLGYWKQTEHPRERSEAAALLRHADGRHGAARDRPQQHPVPVRLGDHGAFGLLPGRRPRTTKRRSAKPVGSTWSRPTWRPLSCSPSLRLLRAASGSFALGPLQEPQHLTPGMATAIFVLALVGFRPQGRHHAAARLAAQLRTRSRRATSRPSCRASSSRWASTAWSG